MTSAGTGISVYFPAGVAGPTHVRACSSAFDPSLPSGHRILRMDSSAKVTQRRNRNEKAVIKKGDAF